MSDPQVLVVGSGPAGISAALWLRDLEIPFAWWSGSGLGGTLRRVGNAIHNYPGVNVGHGMQLVRSFAAQLQELALAPVADAEVVAIEASERGWRARREGGGALDVDALLLATGTRPRLLGLPGEEEWLGRGVEISVTRRRDDYRAKPVVVVGGGDAALEGALLLAEVDCWVHLVHRNPRLRAQRRFARAAQAHPRVTLYPGRRVQALHTSERIEGVTLDDGTRIEARGLFERIGVQPSLPVGVPQTSRRPNGFLRVTLGGRVCDEVGLVVPGLYAAGDIMDAEHQSVAWSVGTAARTVASIRIDLQSG